MKNQRQLDANEAVYFTGALEKVLTQVYEKQYPDLLGASGRIFPITSEAGEAADIIKWHYLDSVGTAKIITDYSDDLPMVDVQGAEQIATVKDLGNSYQYSVREIQKAAMMNFPLESARAVMARRAMDEKIDQLIWYGDATHNIAGILGTTPATRGLVENVNPYSNFATETNFKTALSNLVKLVNNFKTSTKGTETVSTIVMSESMWDNLDSLYSDDNPYISVLDAFRTKRPNIELLSARQLDNLDDVAGDYGFLLINKDSSKISVEIPGIFRSLEPEKRNLAYVVDNIARFGGLLIRVPLSAKLYTNRASV